MTRAINTILDELDIDLTELLTDGKDESLAVDAAKRDLIDNTELLEIAEAVTGLFEESVIQAFVDDTIALVEQGDKTTLRGLLTNDKVMFNEDFNNLVDTWQKNGNLWEVQANVYDLDYDMFLKEVKSYI